MAIDVDVYKWLGSPGCCNVMFVADMWRERIVSGVDAFVVGPNRASSVNGTSWLTIGTNARMTEKAVTVEGRFGRTHLSPRMAIEWDLEQSFTQGYGNNKLRFWYATSGGPPSTPWVVLRAATYPVGNNWTPITLPFEPLQFPRYVPSRPWSVCTGCASNL